MSDIYWERQTGGLCRKHALNAYFGCPKINCRDFQLLCIEFDKYIKAKGYPYSQINKFDCIYSSQETVISYVIGKYHKKYCLHIPVGKINDYLNKRKVSLMKLVGDDDFIFNYNVNHIYGYKKVNGYWYLIDSLKGVHATSNIPISNKLGYIIPRNDPYEDMLFNLKRLTDIKNEGLERYLSSNDILGDIEILLATTADIIGILGGFKYIKKYYKFLHQFEKDPGHYNMDELIDIIDYFISFADR